MNKKLPKHCNSSQIYAIKIIILTGLDLPAYSEFYHIHFHILLLSLRNSSHRHVDFTSLHLSHEICADNCYISFKSTRRRVNIKRHKNEISDAVFFSFSFFFVSVHITQHVSVNHYCYHCHVQTGTNCRKYYSAVRLCDNWLFVFIRDVYV